MGKQIHLKNSLYFIALFGLVLVGGFILNPGEAYAAPTTFTVTNTNDSGAGSLRQAITDANDNDNNAEMDTINFNISGSQVHTISPATSLPSVDEKLTINGYSQTGAQVNTAVAPAPLNNVIKIELDFSTIDNSGQVGIQIDADQSVVKGLAIFSESTITQYLAFAADDVVLAGNYGGLRADGMTRVISDGNYSTTGEFSMVAYFSSSNSGCQVGGLNPGDRNVIAALPGTTGNGAIKVESSGCVIQGNYIGLAKDGITDFAAGVGELTNPTAGSAGMHIANEATVGGTEEGAINVLSGNEVYQLNLIGNDNVVQGNYFGTDYTGQTNDSIVNGMGIVVVDSIGDLIGGTDEGEGNIIAATSGTGVAVVDVNAIQYSSVITAQRTAILGNKIYDINVFAYEIFGDSNQGIDHLLEDIYSFDPFEVKLTNQGPTPNDPGDSDAGPNNYLNTPVLKSAQQIDDELTVTYDLDATDAPDDEYRIEIFANDESTIFGAGPAQELVGVVEVSENGEDQTTVFQVGGDYTNKALSATATAIDETTYSGFGATSELAKNISVGSETDFDSDGSPDAVEEFGPNDGDANDDGTADYLQPTITTYEIDSTGVYATFITEGCSENGTVASIDVSSLPQQDGSYEYPYGLTDFTLNCSRGDTVNVTKYIWDDVGPDNFVVRKYNPETDSYLEIEDSTIANETVAGTTGLKLTYSITDGSEYDDDATENGIIVDPVGLAVLGTSSTNTDSDSGGVSVPNTGVRRLWWLGSRP